MRKLFIALALTASVAAQAQIEDDKNVFNHLSVGLNVGTSAIGFEVGTTVCPFVTMRVGADFMPKFTVKNTLKYDRPAVLNNVTPQLLEERYVNIPEYGAEIDVKGKPNFNQGKVLFDIYTGKNSMFHFTVGAYFGSSRFASVKAVDKTIAAVELYNSDIKNGYILPEPGYENGINIDLEGYNLTPNKGRAQLDVKINGFRPYIGFGVGRTVPRKRVGCKLDVGVEFWGKPEIIDKYANDGKGHVITKDEPGISKDFQDVIKTVGKIPVYPTLKFSIFGRIF
ncbi:MAG: hypothetical protein KBT39_11580 [Bacteroidales bacterium]|nr:hypothetical protein [Bacteroidales bacterium]